MQMAIDVAGFTPAEADELRQAMGSKRSVARMERLRGRFFAGMAELTGEDRSIQPARIASLLATARDVFPQGGDYGDAQPWAGLRPATPKGEPVTGTPAGAPRNLVLNTGHGALGFTLAFGSARRVARMISG